MGIGCIVLRRFIIQGLLITSLSCIQDIFCGTAIRKSRHRQIVEPDCFAVFVSSSVASGVNQINISAAVQKTLVYILGLALCYNSGRSIGPANNTLAVGNFNVKCTPIYLKACRKFYVQSTLCILFQSLSLLL